MQVTFRQRSTYAAKGIKLVRTYRLTAGLAERLRLAEELIRLIEPDLRLWAEAGRGRKISEVKRERKS